MLSAILWSALATGTILIGMALAYRNLVSQRWTGLIMAFGAGAIISAAAYQLVLGSAAEVAGSYLVVGLGIAAGALTFYFADRWVDSLGGADRMDMDGAQASGSGTGILLGSLLDGVPESLVLGMSLVHSPQVSMAFIFAVAISNIPQRLGGTGGMDRPLSRDWPCQSGGLQRIAGQSTRVRREARLRSVQRKAGLLSLVGDERFISTVELAVRSAEVAFAAANSPSNMTGD